MKLGHFSAKIIMDFDNQSTRSYDLLVSVKILRPLAMFKHPFESSMLIGALNKEKALVETYSEHSENFVTVR